MTNINNMVQAIPLQRVPIVEQGYDLRPVSEAVAFFLTGNAELDEVRRELRDLIYGPGRHT